MTDTLEHLKKALLAYGSAEWFVSAEPRLGFSETFTILEGNPDPHAGTAILETLINEELDEFDDQIKQQALALLLEAMNPAAVSAIVEELEWLRDATEWRPIKTAPTDGTPFVAVNFKTGSSRFLRCGEFKNGERGWFGPDWDDGDTDDELRASYTHWQPAPTPPEAV